MTWRPATTMSAHPAQIEKARSLLAQEGASGGSSQDYAAAAGRVYDKLHAHLAPLLGSAGVQALLVRSARLVQRESASLAGVGAALDNSSALSASLQALDPASASTAAEALFGTFFTLLATFIGERLTLEALRRAWPTIQETAPTENT